VPGTNHARAIISGSALPVGIGEALQWFNPSKYGLPSFPFMATFNDWGCNDGQLCGHCTFNYLSQDDGDYAYWYGPGQKVYLEVSEFGSRLIFPDAILHGSLISGRNGHPGIGFSSTCYDGPNPPFSSDHLFTYCKGIGFFDNPSNVPYAAPMSQPYFEFDSPNHAWPFAGDLESVSPDTHGWRMFVPRLARNEYGYIPPQSYHGPERTWITYLYYNPSQINDNPGDACDDYNHWDAPSSSQSIAVSRITITEKCSQRIRT
jgi:hypothetical protein